MLFLLCAAVLFQDPAPADLKAASDKFGKVKSCAYTLVRSDGSRKETVHVEAVFADGALHVRMEDVEVIRAAGGTLAKVGESGWIGIAQAKERLKTPETDRSGLLLVLASVPFPQALNVRFFGVVESVSGKGSTFEGKIAGTAANALQDEAWFMLGDDRRISSPTGSGKAFLDSNGGLAGLELSIAGKLLPQPGNGQRPPRQPPQGPPQNPRGTRRYDTPDVAFTLSIKFDKLNEAKLSLPDDVLKRLGIAR